MIIWLNSAHGTGAPEVAEELRQLLPRSTVYDPRPFAAALRELLPKERLAQVEEIHELPSWPRLFAEAALAVLAEVPGPLITAVPLSRQEDRDEIFGALAARRVEVRHFLLDADETILRARIDDFVHQEGEATRAWCRERLPTYRAARAWLAADAYTVDTTHRTPRQSASAVAAALERGGGHRAIVQTPEPSGETVASGVLLFDSEDRVLLVDPTYKPGWEFPGGVVEPGEAPVHAGVREVAEELDVRLTGALSLLVVDWERPSPPAFGGLRLLFDGGRLSERQITELRLPSAELRGWRFVSESAAAELLPEMRRERLRWALRARRLGRPLYLEAGVPTDG